MQQIDGINSLFFKFILSIADFHLHSQIVLSPCQKTEEPCFYAQCIMGSAFVICYIKANDLMHRKILCLNPIYI